jgi:heavy metal sensor kinase
VTRWGRRSIRVRLTLWYAGALAIVLFAYAIAVYGFLQHSLRDELASPAGDALAEHIKRELGELQAILALGLPIALAIAAIGGYALARRALAPIGRIAERARHISAERLAQRLPVDNPDDEIGQLASVFNETLARLENSFEQLRRFTADASHELRTPLTAIRSVGEVGLQEHRGEAAYRETIGSMLEEADRLTRLVDSLLTLARADAGQIRLNPETVDLADLSRDVAQYLSALSEEKKQTVSIQADHPVQAFVDRIVFRQAVINLVDNAIKYSPQRGDIRITVTRDDANAILEVMDSGAGIDAALREQIFDRFYRIDKGRSRESGGVGLGLSIARWAVVANGGVIEVTTTSSGGSTFQIRVPIRPSLT